MYDSRRAALLVRRWAVPAACVAMLAGRSSGAEPLTLTRPRSGVLVVRDSSFASSMTFVRTAAGLLVVDSFMFRTSTRQALEHAADSLGQKRVAMVINTHGHDDHVWGNQVLVAEGPAPPIAAHPATAANVRARIPQMAEFFRHAPEVIRIAEDSLNAAGLDETTRARLAARISRARSNLTAHADLVVTPPTVEIARDTAFTVGGLRIHLRAVGRAHSAGDLAVLIPSERLMIVGDLALHQQVSGLDERDGDLDNWIESLNRLAREARELRVQHVVLGHGGMGTPASLDSARLYLQTLADSVTAAQRRGSTLADVGALRLKGFETWARYDRNHPRNVTAAWRMLARRDSAATKPVQERSSGR